MPIEPKAFTGIMDSDSPLAKVGAMNHVMALNGHFRGVPGNYRFENTLGNRDVANTYLPLVAICPLITGLVAMVSGTTITYYFNKSYSAVTNYDIKLIRESDSAVVQTNTSTNNFGTFTGVASDNYFVQVLAHCSNGTDSGNANSAQLFIGGTCGVVSGVIAIVSNSTVSFSFAASTSMANNYTVQLYDSTDILKGTKTITGTTGSFFNVSNGTYYVKVTTNCSNGISSAGVNSNNVTVSYTQPIQHTIELIRNGPNLTAIIIVDDDNSVVAPFSYHFYCVATGACSAYNLANPDQTTNDTSATTSFSYTQYAAAKYTFYVRVTDANGSVSTSDGYTAPTCLVPETKIRVFDNTDTLLRDIAVEEKLADIDGQENLVTSFSIHKVSEIYDINNGLLRTSNGHINILFDGSLCISEDLREGMMLRGEYGQPVKIISIDVEQGDFEVINISTTTKMYIANGILTHNKLQCP